MEVGEYYQKNQRKLNKVTESDWKVALKLCKDHIVIKLRQRTLSGAHSASQLGAEPIDHYLGVAYEKILSGEWEWKDDFTLGQQMIRIANSSISKSVEKAETVKGKASKIVYCDIEEEFYDIVAPITTQEEEVQMEGRLRAIEDAAAGEEDLEFMIEGLKEGKKRNEIADLLGIGVRQLDKLREKLIRRAKAKPSAS